MADDYRVPIYVDPRIGSGELAEPLRLRNLPVTVFKLQYGDLQVPIVRGPNDMPLLIGIERKTIFELVTCIGESRYTGSQLPGLRNSYPIVMLFVEGMWSADRNGHLTIMREREYVPYHWLVKRPRPVEVSTIRHFLFTQRLRARVHIEYPKNPTETVDIVKDLYTYGISKPWEEHKSHTDWDTEESFRDSVQMGTRPGRAAQVFRKLPGVGPEYAIAAEIKFGSVFQGVYSTIEDWANLVSSKGVRLGTKTAKGILEAKGWLKR